MVRRAAEGKRFTRSKGPRARAFAALVFLAGVFGARGAVFSADLHDFALFQTCFGTSPLQPNCSAFDYNPDQQIDLVDFQAFFQLMFSAPDLIRTPMPGAKIAAGRVTVFGNTPQGACTITANNFLAFLQPNGNYFVPTVPLTPGPNKISVKAIDCEGTILTQAAIDVLSTTETVPFTLTLSQQSIPIGGAVTATATSSFSLVRIQADQNADHILDVASDGPAVTMRFDDPGMFPLWVMVETSDGLFFSNELATRGVPINSVRVGQEVAISDNRPLLNARDIELTAENGAWILSDTPSTITKLDRTLTTIESLPLIGFDGANGLAVSTNGDFIIAHTSANRVARLSANGTPVMSFGNAGFVTQTHGSASTFAGPADVAVGEDDRIFVADRDHNRIVKLASYGAFVADRPTEAAPLALANASGLLLVAQSNGSILILRGSDLSLASRITPTSSPIVRIAATSSLVSCITDTGRLFVHNLSGMPIHAPFPSVYLEPFRLAIPLEGALEESFVAANEDQVFRITVADAPVLQPQATWEAFVAALREGNLPRASTFVADRFQAELQRRFGSATPDQLSEFGGRLSTTLTVTGGLQDRLTFTTALSGLPAPLYVSMERQSASVAWRIVAF